MKAWNVFLWFRLFAKEPNWGRVATLMYFAYFIIMRFAKEKAKILPQFLKDIVSHVVRFIKEKLAGWIARQGGWVSRLYLMKQLMNYVCHLTNRLRLFKLSEFNYIISFYIQLLWGKSSYELTLLWEICIYKNNRILENRNY